MENRNRNLNIQIPGRLKHMDEQTIRQRISTQRDFFATGATLPLSFRLKQLEQLKLALKRHEQDLYTALKADLGKSRMESYMCEIGLTLSELTWMQRHLPKLMRCKTVPTPLAHFAAKSFQSPSPYGTVLIMSPWNYPKSPTSSNRPSWPT